MKKILVSACMVLFCTALISAPKVEGKWKATIETNGGTYSYTVEYKVDGDKLTGTLYSTMGNFELTGGKISGNEFEYTYHASGYTIKHNGKLVEEDKIEIKSSGDLGEREYTLTRVKNE